MTFAEFSALIGESPDGVVLLEGRRSISDTDAGLARMLAAHLAARFPLLRFRSGNAPGSDQAFAEGVASVDPSRLQVVAPYATHRSGIRYSEAVYESPDSLSPVQEDEVVYKTARATPKNKGLLTKRGMKGALGAKAAYLIRDTMKVTGHSPGFPKPLVAVFYVDPDDPWAGGTGHTIRVCRQEAVPCVFQDDWMRWVAS